MSALRKDRSLLMTSAFAKYCGTTRDTLLWYDRQGLLKPSAVGENGYRYYHAAQLAEFDMISLLTQAGNSLPEIRALLSDQAQDPVALFESKAAALEDHIRALTRMQTLARRMADGVRAVQSCRSGVPECIRLEAAPLAVTALAPEERFYADVEKSMEAFNRHLRMGTARPDIFRYPLGTILCGADFLQGAYTDRALFYEAVAPEGEGMELRPAGTYVQAFHLGDFSRVEETLSGLRRYLTESGLQLAGDVYEYDMLTFLAQKDGLGYATRFLLPVKKRD